MNDLVPCCEKVFRFVSTLWRCLLVFKNIRVDCWSPNVCLCGNTEGICIAMRWGYGRQWEIAQGIKTARTGSQQPKQESSRWLKYTGPNLRIPDPNIDVDGEGWAGRGWAVVGFDVGRGSLAAAPLPCPKHSNRTFRRQCLKVYRSRFLWSFSYSNS